ncbi:unnamed protein product [Triticum turgidum subsp. durum]|uniref:Glutathione S-transferase n=1 Tax=Triticum turgidum subsp. durum TaxID=4567 RepID=A0A9R0W4I4_TRITD|nr:unnamed protein product [Triticum turgidum subsp. durum]
MSQQTAQAPAPVRLITAFGSPFAHRVEVALTLKGVPYELLVEDLANKSELLLAHNPVHQSVPVLLHGDRAVCESLLIVEYVDESFHDDEGSALRLLPADPYERATARFWADFIANKCLKSLCGRRCGRTVRSRRGWRGRPMRAWGPGRAAGGEEVLRGDALGFVDLAACTLAHWLGVLEDVAGVRLMADGEYPALRRWAKEYTSDEVVRQSLPDREELVAYFTKNKRVVSDSTVPAAW